MSTADRTEQLNISLPDWSEPACRTAMAKLIECMRSNYEVANLNVSFVVGGRALSHDDFFAQLVATGFELSSEYSILSEIYLRGPWSYRFGEPSNMTREEEAKARGWRHSLARSAIKAVDLPDEAMISLLLSTNVANPLQAKLAQAAVGDFTDGSASIRAKFRDEIILNLYEKQGWSTVASIKLGVERSLCECDGNPAYIRPGLMESASKLLKASDFVQLLTDRASNLPWRMVGCERWPPHSYLNLFREGLDLQNAYQRDIAALLRRHSDRR